MGKSVPSRKRVAVTGIGAVTALGNTFNDTWNRLMEGATPAGDVQRFDASRYPTRIAYEVKDFKFASDRIPAQTRDVYLNRAGEYGINALLEAAEQADLPKDVDPYRVAMCMGTGVGMHDFDWFRDVLMKEAYDSSDIVGVKERPSSFAPVAAQLVGAKGGTTTVHTACASSGQSIGEAFEMIAYGEADVVYTGGTDSMISPYYFAGFSLLGALSTRNDEPTTASRPFDAARNGFVLGEGACVLVLEEYEHAKARGANIIGELAGYGVTESAYRITDLHPEGSGPKEAMEMAVADADISPSEVKYINAHGTSTLLNDRIETLAVSKVFPETTHVSSSKGATGHLISAAGAIELAFCINALKNQVLPPSVNLFKKDPDIKASLCATEPTDCSFEYALSNSVGFGGSNTAIIAKKVSS